MIPLQKRKAVSPVIATVILVAVAITVAVGVSYWMGGISAQYTQFEKVEISTGYSVVIAGPPSGWHILMSLKNSGSATATITHVFVNDVPIKCFNLTQDTSDVTYLWEVGDGNTSSIQEPTHVYQEPGRFDITLTAVNGNLCEGKYTFSYVEVEPSGELLFPTVFKPNPDGPSDGKYVPGQDNNQVFFPGVYDQVIEYEMTIYNRWGEQIFISNSVDVGWDGYVKGEKMAQQGVYIWQVKGKYANGKSFVHVGDITLLK